MQRKSLLIVLIPLMFWAKSHAVAAESVALPQTAAIHIDGRWEEKQWMGFADMGDFFVFRDDAFKAPKTQFKMGTDGTYLYIGAKLEDHSPDTLKVDAEDQGRVYADDSVEIFIDPGHSFTGLLQLAVNTKNKTKIQGYGPLYSKLAPQDLGWDTAVHVADNFWTMEAKIPLANCGLSAKCFEKGKANGFLVNFARNLRNPHYTKHTVRGFRYIVRSELGFFDRKGFLPVHFDGPRGDLEMTFPGDHITDLIEMRPTFKSKTQGKRTLGLGWYERGTESGKRAKPAELMVNETQDKEALLLQMDIDSPEKTFRLEVTEKGKTLFVKDFLYTMSPAVTIWPQFPCKGDLDQRDIVIKGAPYLEQMEGEKVVFVKINQGLKLIGQYSIVKFEKESKMAIHGKANKLAPGWYTITAEVSVGGNILAAKQFKFCQGQTVADPQKKPVFDHWGFEKAVTAKKAPRLWRHPHTPDALYPYGIKINKKAAWWDWGDLQKDPNAVFEGKRSLVLKGYGPGAQLHMSGGWFKPDLKARYQLQCTVRGKGKISARYYIKNKNKKWLNEYFDTRVIDLTEHWETHVFDPIKFNKHVFEQWNKKPVAKDATLPHRVELIFWVHQESKAYLDNLMLTQW